LVAVDGLDGTERGYQRRCLGEVLYSAAYRILGVLHLPENIKGETTSSRPAVLNDTVRMTHTLMEQKIQDKAKRIAESNKRKWESNKNQAGGSNINRNNIFSLTSYLFNSFS
ncbi:hypothetical protein Tco_0259195, partial [Tanacetum coccineum]